MLAADSIPHAFDQGAAGRGNPGKRRCPGTRRRRDAKASARRLGHWMLERMLGRGGMGTVYAARRDDRDTLQRAAVKRLHRRWDGSLQAQRFLQERRILAALSHPNIPRLLDHGLDDDGRPWFALELVEGKPLTTWADERRLDLRERLDLFRALCTAVQHAHEHFVVHRDLKPANILVDGEGHPRVLDFGIAKRIDDARRRHPHGHVRRLHSRLRGAGTDQRRPDQRRDRCLCARRDPLPAAGRAPALHVSTTTTCAPPPKRSPRVPPIAWTRRSPPAPRRKWIRGSRSAAPTCAPSVAS